jgi:hypothetical protein
MDENVKQIELEITEAREWLEQAERLERLRQNPDFIALIEEGYFKEEAARIVNLKADPQFVFAGEEQMAFLNILEAGVGALQQHFRKIDMQADAARRGIGEMEQTQIDVNQEALEQTEGNA